MNIAFLGSSEFSLNILKKLCQKHSVKVVVCNIDKEVGRGKNIHFNAVKTFCLEKNIPLIQTEKISSEEGEKTLKSYNADILITASFGQILKKNILNLTRLGCINVHPSLLPKYRGSSPVQSALLNGEKQTGVTIMKTELKLDSGDIIKQKSIDILEDETAGELSNRLSLLGGDLLLEALYDFECGKVKYIKQDDTQATFCKKLDREHAFIDFNKRTQEILNFIRALNPWPVAQVKSSQGVIKVYEGEAFKKEVLGDFKVGQVALNTSKTGLVVKCLDGFILLTKIQGENSKIMSSKDYLNGKKLQIGESLQ